MAGATNPIEGILCFLLRAAAIILLIRVVVSWLPVLGIRMPSTGPVRTATDLLNDVTEPVLRPLRKVVPSSGGFDLSVVVAFVIIFVLQTAICD
jgi:YggT family protein